MQMISFVWYICLECSWESGGHSTKVDLREASYTEGLRHRSLHIARGLIRSNVSFTMDSLEIS